MNIVQAYIRQFPVLKDMVLLIKHLLKVHNLNDPYSGGISSYALTLMIVSFLQFQVFYCPPMHTPDFYKAYEHQHEDTGLTIAQFFHFYYYFVDIEKYVIAPNLPDQIPQQYPVYQKFMGAEDKLCITDPLNPANNVGKSSFNLDEIKECFKEACEVLYSNSSELNKLYDQWRDKVMKL